MKVRELQDALQKAFRWGYCAANARPQWGTPECELWDHKVEELSRDYARQQVQLVLGAESERTV